MKGTMVCLLQYWSIDFRNLQAHAIVVPEGGDRISLQPG